MENQCFLIGNAKSHCEYEVIEIEGVATSVSLSETTESVYVYYTNIKTLDRVVVRYSNHQNNAVKFGDQLNGNILDKNELLFRLGLKTRVFIQNKSLHISWRNVKKSEISDYKQSEMTLRDLYALGAGSDISAHTGKLAKGTNQLILGNIVEEFNDYTTDCFGNKVALGKFIYKDI